MFDIQQGIMELSPSVGDGRKRPPGVPGTLKPADLDPRDFEKARRLEAKQLKMVYPKNNDDSGPSLEEQARFNQQKILKSQSVKEGDMKPGEEHSVLHFKVSKYDVSYMDLPRESPEYYKYPVDTPSELHCELPRQCITSLLGHGKGVNTVQFNRRFGHLLLSGGLDCRVKLWTALPYEKDSQPCLRTFMGHDRPIRQALFEPCDGSSFISLGADRFIKLWDVESGKCTLSLEQKRTPTCASFHTSTCFLVGSTDGRIQLWDARQKAMAREYWHHTDSICTLTPLDQDVFVSTSEDRTLKVWEFSDPVPRFVLQKPDVCEVYAAALKHPTTNTILCSALSSELTSFAFDKTSFALRRRQKQLVGHKAGGMVVRPACSPDGRFVAAGDGAGALHFWDWVSGQSARSIEQSHEQAITDCSFSFVDPRLLATCSLDGTIKLWN